MKNNSIPIPNATSLVKISTLVIPKRLNLEFLFCVTVISYRAMRLTAHVQKTVSITPLMAVMGRRVNFQTAVSGRREVIV